MEKHELKNKINEFCKNKNFENPFIQDRTIWRCYFSREFI